MTPEGDQEAVRRDGGQDAAEGAGAGRHGLQTSQSARTELRRKPMTLVGEKAGVCHAPQ